MRLLSTVAVLAITTVAAAAADNPPAPSSAPVPKGAYATDKAHTSLLFRVNHLGFSEFTGRFTSVIAKLSFDPRALATSSVTVEIDPKSIATDNAPDGFLAMLAGDKFLDAAKYPRMTFASTSVEPGANGNFRIRGTLTLHGVTKPMMLEAHYNGGYAGHPYDPHARVGFSAHGTLKRSDFGITTGIPSAAMPWGVGDEVEVRLETEFSGPALK
ncbi:MAG TPA: YceI family protein [Steroidobacteraceae bacterium]|nr:YceI family protein [Steroidobacteraceae bacterium]